MEVAIEQLHYQGNLVALQTAQVACAVKLFMMAVKDGDSISKVSNRDEHVTGELEVPMHLALFFLGQRFWLLQNQIRDAEFPNVMQENPPAYG
jgi:hypothetical protein